MSFGALEAAHLGVDALGGNLTVAHDHGLDELLGYLGISVLCPIEMHPTDEAGNDTEGDEQNQGEDPLAVGLLALLVYRLLRHRETVGGMVVGLGNGSLLPLSAFLLLGLSGIFLRLLGRSLGDFLGFRLGSGAMLFLGRGLLLAPSRLLLSLLALLLLHRSACRYGSLLGLLALLGSFLIELLLLHKACGSEVFCQRKGGATVCTHLCLICIFLSAIAAVHNNAPFSLFRDKTFKYGDILYQNFKDLSIVSGLSDKFLPVGIQLM